MWFQPLNGALRPAAPRPGAPATRYRLAWEKAHKYIGIFLISFGLIVLLTGARAGREEQGHARGACC